MYYCLQELFRFWSFFLDAGANILDITIKHILPTRNLWKFCPIGFLNHTDLLARAALIPDLQLPEVVMWRKKNGQITLEYMIIVGSVVAFITVFVARQSGHWQTRLREGHSDVADGLVTGSCRMKVAIGTTDLPDHCDEVDVQIP